MTGQLLDGRYQIVQVLGRGTFGQTFLAKDIKRPGSPACVVKQLRYLSNDPQGLQIARRLFKKEAETLEKLGQHDQIPTLLADLEENQEFYLVQQFIAGHPLTEEIIVGKPWSEDRVISLLIEVLQILVFVHGQGVIHRDIKPANLMRRQSDGKIVLIDFGAVKEIGTQIAQGKILPTVVIGTPGYMPIEQFHGQPQLNSDIYALGMMGIQALLGLAANELSKLQVSHPPHLAEGGWRSRKQVSANLADILDKMVKPDYFQRYQSATEVLKDIEKLSTISRNSTIPSPIIASVQKTQPHQPQAARRFIGAGIATLLVAGGLAGTFYYLQSPQIKASEFYNRGLEKSKKADKKGAIADFNQAIQLNPNYAEAYYQRANARFHLADYTGAIEDATQAIRINPNYAEAYRRRCTAQGNLNHYQAAIEDCTQAIRIDPVNADAYSNRAATYYRLGNKQKAIADSTQAIQINPQLAVAYINRGLARKDLGDRQGAMEDYTRAIGIDPKDAGAYINRSELYLTLKAYQDAIADANQVIGLQPNNAFAYYNRGLAYRALGNKQAALTDFQKTTKLCLDQSNSSCYKNIQNLISELQKPEPTAEPTTIPVQSVSQPAPKPQPPSRQRKSNIRTRPPRAIEPEFQPEPQPLPEIEATSPPPSPSGATNIRYRYKFSPSPEPTAETQPSSEPEPTAEPQPSPEPEPTVEPASEAPPTAEPDSTATP